MAKRQYVVRVVQKENDKLAEKVDETFLECLRYAGMVRVHDVQSADPLEYQCFDLLPPNGVDSKPWAEINAQRMRTFGFLATVSVG